MASNNRVWTPPSSTDSKNIGSEDQRESVHGLRVGGLDDRAMRWTAYLYTALLGQ